MGGDMKDKLLRDIELKLSLQFDTETREKVMQCIIASLKDYDISERVTDLVVRHEDINERILKRYVACLRIDGMAESTIKGYVYTLKHLESMIGKPYQEMSAYDVRYFLGDIKARGCKNSHAENQRSYIAAFFKWMYTEELIERNPCEKIRPIKVEKEIRLPFTAVDMDKLRTACRQPKERAIIETLISSGIRCEEMCSLKINDVDLEKLTLRVRHGKGGKDRVVYISDVAAAHIKDYLSRRKEETDVLFVSRTGGRYTTNGILVMVTRLGKRAGVEKVHPHRFRRTFATECRRRGMDIHTISKLMGHSNIDTTERYIYTADDQLQADYRKYSA